MYLMDVNIFVYAHREDVTNHAEYRQWLESVINANTAFAYSERVLSDFLRVVTHPKIFETPSPLSKAIHFTEQIRNAPNAVRLAPGPGHWKIFTECLKQTHASGNDIPAAYHAALAMEWNCEWVSADKGFKRFKGLKTRDPLKLMKS